MKIVIVLLSLLYITNIGTSFKLYPKLKHVKPADSDVDPGEPLFLTPLIEAGKIKEAQAQSEVKYNGFKNITSYSGFLTVDKKLESNIFFWFFPAQNDYENAPVVLWLQGGPGASSLIGLFLENGPFSVRTKHGLKSRKYSWNLNHSVLYIDNPVGTGFSFTKNDNGYAKDETDVGNNLYSALVQFYQLFPELQKNDFFITGESYAGKYVPAAAYAVHKNNPNSKTKINMKGIAIGNGLSDPEHQLNYGDYLYKLGLIDIEALGVFHQYQQKGVEFIQQKKWLDAQLIFDQLINGDFDPHTLFRNTTGFSNYFNYLVANDTSNNMGLISAYLSRNDIHAALHVGNMSFQSENLQVEQHLRSDLMQSVAPWITELLSHYRVLIYNGQLDIIVAYPLTLNYLQNLKFDSADEYKVAKRHIWYVDGEIAGYVKAAGNLTEMLVRNAGHMVPTDQPKWALDLITRFTHEKPFY